MMPFAGPTRILDVTRGLADERARRPDRGSRPRRDRARGTLMGWRV